MNAQGQLRETFTRGVGLAGDTAGAGLVAVTHHAGSWTNGMFYIHHNHRGDVILTRSGTITVGTYSYSAFGNLSSVLGPDVCRFKFSSKEREVSTGFSYFGRRFYAPTWQRWINSDPIREAGGLNTYRICVNNPVTLTDTLGLSCFKDCINEEAERIWNNTEICLCFSGLATGGAFAGCVLGCVLSKAGWPACFAAVCLPGTAIVGGATMAACAAYLVASAAGIAAGCAWGCWF